MRTCVCVCVRVCVVCLNSYRTFVSEDAGPNTLVATVLAKDPDGDGITYKITTGNEEGNFVIDSQKGKRPSPSGKPFHSLLCVSFVLHRRLSSILPHVPLLFLKCIAETHIGLVHQNGLQ